MFFDKIKTKLEVKVYMKKIKLAKKLTDNEDAIRIKRLE